MYPAVFDDFMNHATTYSKEVTHLATKTFTNGMSVGEEITVPLETGKNLVVKLLSTGAPDSEGYVDCVFEMNGLKRTVRVNDKTAVASETIAHKKADENVAGSIGAPMPGVVVEIKAQKGDLVEEGDVLVVLSAMKMETNVSSPVSGKITNIQVTAGDHLLPGDLLVEVEEE